jgi:hypothetical protein
MTGIEMANIASTIFFGVIILLALGMFVTIISGVLYAILKAMFGKKSDSKETEPGQLPKKTKKAAAAPAVEDFAPERIEPTFGDSPALAAHTVARHIPDEEQEAIEPDAAVIERDAAFADRMADQFAAQAV